MFPYINMFNHEVPAMISAMQNLRVGVFEHIEITSAMDIYLRIKYMERILRARVLNKCIQVLLECKYLEKG